MQTRLGIIYTILSALGYGSTAVLVLKAYQGGVTAWQLLLAQYLFLLVFLVIFLIFRRRNLQGLGKALPYLILNGVVGYSGMSICYTLSLQYITGSVATLIFFTYPIMVAIGSKLVFGEHFTANKVWALVLAIIGVVFTSGVLQGVVGRANLTGIILSFTTALLITFLVLVAQKLLLDIDPLDVATVQHLCATLTMCLIIMGLGYAKPATIPGTAWFWGFFLALLTTMLPSFYSLKGIALLGAYKASVIATLEIPLTLALVFIFLQEKMTIWQGLGSLLIIASVFVLKRHGDTPAEAMVISEEQECPRC